MKNVAFLGGGSFGTALGILLANKGHKVSIYDRDKTVVDDINIKNTETPFFFFSLFSFFVSSKLNFICLVSSSI